MFKIKFIDSLNFIPMRLPDFPEIRSFHWELATDEEIRRYFDQHEANTPLEPRLDFYGGRTKSLNCIMHVRKGKNKVC